MTAARPGLTGSCTRRCTGENKGLAAEIAGRMSSYGRATKAATHKPDKRAAATSMNLAIRIRSVARHSPWALIIAVALALVLPAVASAYCEPYVVPYECTDKYLNEHGLLTSGTAARCQREQKEGEQAYAECVQQEHEYAEAKERREAEEAKLRRERLEHEEARLAEAKYAREHPAPTSAPQAPTSAPQAPTSAPQSTPIPPTEILTLREAYVVVGHDILRKTHAGAFQLSDTCWKTSSSAAKCKARWIASRHPSSRTLVYFGTFVVEHGEWSPQLRNDLYATFAGLRARYGCARRLGVKRCGSHVHWSG
jgi:hypothetical protein